MSHPYRDLPATAFWRRSVATPGPHEIDPLLGNPIQIGAGDAVATLGSCFAQHLSRFLRRTDIDYLVTEPGPPGMSEDERAHRTYGVYTARFGNVYTVRQAVQLVDRAYGRWTPDEPAWRRDDGRWVDPFRPTVEPDGFASPEDVAGDRVGHFAAVRRMLEDASVVVFTLGLTEGWRSRRTGAVYPVVPGAAGGAYDPSEHEFVNFDVATVISDLTEFADRLAEVNGQARLLLTVSPVPIIATYSDQHVLAASTYTKSVLRVAATEVARVREHVHYFPSYEVVTGVPSGNRYYTEDLRSVNDDGIAHVMRIFRRHYITGGEGQLPDEPGLRSEIARVESVICDEDVLDPPPGDQDAAGSSSDRPARAPYRTIARSAATRLDAVGRKLLRR